VAIGWSVSRYLEHSHYLLKELGYKTRDVCATNLIFVTSRSIEELKYGELSNFKQIADYCWEYHKILLEIIQPNVILCFGNGEKSSYSYIYSKYGGEEKNIKANHGNWKCKAFKTVIEGRKTNVVSIPHLSRYKIKGKIEVLNWIKSYL